MRFTAALLASAVCGCATGDIGGAGPASDAPVELVRLEASGYLHSRDSVIDPYCGAVLIAPALAVTAGHCVEDHPPYGLSIGFGDVGSGELVAVEEIWLRERYGAVRAVEDDVGVLFLREPVASVVPAPVARIDAPPRAAVQSVSYAFVMVGHTGARRVVAGDVAESGARAVVRFLGEQPNCHGDSGAGLFGADGTLLGIASGGSAGTSGCFESFHFAATAHNIDLLDAAMDEADRRWEPPIF